MTESSVRPQMTRMCHTEMTQLALNSAPGSVHRDGHGPGNHTAVIRAPLGPRRPLHRRSGLDPGRSAFGGTEHCGGAPHGLDCPRHRRCNECILGTRCHDARVSAPSLTAHRQGVGDAATSGRSSRQMKPRVPPAEPTSVQGAAFDILTTAIRHNHRLLRTPNWSQTWPRGLSPSPSRTVPEVAALSWR